MKKSLSFLFKGLFLVSLVFLFNCSDDATPANTNDLCNTEACVGDSDLAKAARAVCMDATFVPRFCTSVRTYDLPELTLFWIPALKSKFEVPLRENSYW